VNIEELKKRIEVLLFASPQSLDTSALSKAMGEPDRDKLQEAIDKLREEYYSNKGLFIDNIQGGYQIFTKPEYEHLIKRLMDEEKKYNISRAALEVLAIVAVFEPITKPEIESIRGISSDGVIKHLVEIELLEIKGRLKSPGRPILYATSSEFLKYFHLASNEELRELHRKFSDKFELEEEKKESENNYLSH
jgi:segregation and condensation protein B